MVEEHQWWQRWLGVLSRTLPARPGPGGRRDSKRGNLKTNSFLTTSRDRKLNWNLKGTGPAALQHCAMETGIRRKRKARLSRLLGFVAVGFVAGFSQALSHAAEPQLLAHFKLNGDGLDALGNSPPMDLVGVTFTNDTLALPATGNYSAAARISGFSYSSFTVAFDFRPGSFDDPHWNLLSGGPSYRWIGFENDAAGHLILRLNNSNFMYAFTNVLALDQWHTLACAVDLPSQSILTVLDGERLTDVVLQNFQFQVVGTAAEESDKIFSFWNNGNAARFYGQADNLRVFNRALTGPELQTFLTPRLSMLSIGQNVLIYWSSDVTNVVPEWTDSLMPPFRWRTEERSPSLVGEQRVLLDAPAIGTRVYRLRRF